MLIARKIAWLLLIALGLPTGSVIAGQRPLQYRVQLAQTEYLAGQAIIVESVVINRSIKPVTTLEPWVPAYNVTYTVQRRWPSGHFHTVLSTPAGCGGPGYAARAVCLNSGAEMRRAAELLWQFRHSTLPVGEYKLLAHYHPTEPGNRAYETQAYHAQAVSFRVVEPTGAEAAWPRLQRAVEHLAKTPTEPALRQAEDLLEQFVRQSPQSVYVPNALEAIAQYRQQAHDRYGYLRAVRRWRAAPLSETKRNWLIAIEVEGLLQLGQAAAAHALAHQGTCALCEFWRETTQIPGLMLPTPAVGDVLP